MVDEKSEGPNPLNMEELEPGGPFVLPPTLCSRRREEFFHRGNAIGGFYVSISLYSEQGRKNIQAEEDKGELKYNTPITAEFDPGTDSVMRLNYGLLKRLFSNAGKQLTIQVFLMYYGNFEAYISDLLLDGLIDLQTDNPENEAIEIMMRSRWPGKIDRITQKLGVSLGRRRFRNKFRNVDMGFLGDKCSDPIDFLDRMADYRNRIVHSTGRVDAAFASAYPNSGLSKGDVLSLPFGLPNSIHLFFVLLTDEIDRAFVSKFGWSTTLVKPEELIN